MHFDPMLRSAAREGRGVSQQSVLSFGGVGGVLGGVYNQFTPMPAAFLNANRGSASPAVGGGGGGGSALPPSHHYHPDANNSMMPPAMCGSSSLPTVAVTMGDYLTTVAAECEQRGLDTTAAFLGELTTSLSEEVLMSVGSVPIANLDGAQSAAFPSAALGGASSSSYYENIGMLPSSGDLASAANGGLGGRTSSVAGGAASPQQQQGSGGAANSSSARVFGSSASINTFMNSCLRNTAATAPSATPYSIKRCGASGYSPAAAASVGGGGAQQGFSSSAMAATRQSPTMEAIIAKSTFTTALGLFHKGQHRRCFDVLSAVPSSRPSACAAVAAGAMGAPRGGAAPTTNNTNKPLLLLTRRSAFLGLYALFMEGERRKFVANCGSGQSSTALVDGLGGDGLGLGGGGPANPNTAELSRLLDDALRRFPDDGYLLWLSAMVARERKRPQETVCLLLDAVKRNPLLWCAWEDLAKEVTHVAQLEALRAQLVEDVVGMGIALPLPIFSLVLRMFSATVLEGLGLHAEAADEWFAINNGVVVTEEAPPSSSEQLAPEEQEEEGDGNGNAVDEDDNDEAHGGDTPQQHHQQRKKANASNSPPLSAAQNNNAPTATATSTTPRVEVYLNSPNCCPIVQQRMGVCHVGARRFKAALQVLADLRARWPSRLEGMEELSNALFVEGDRLGLSTLAHEAYALDPFSAIANVIVGNYYAVMRKHDRSVYYFKRAVAIEPTLLSAWTLLGHEYLEVKNPNAAAEAYRAALRVDKRDYRAWHSLGQIYELHRMYPYALHYYWHTVELRPNDGRMWQAVAAVLEKLNRTKDMLACLEAAERCSSSSANNTHNDGVGDGSNSVNDGGIDGDNYATIVRTIAQRCLLFDLPKAITYMAKLIACEAHREDDEVHFLPMLVRYFIEKAKRNITPHVMAGATAAIRAGATGGVLGGANNYYFNGGGGAAASPNPTLPGNMASTNPFYVPLAPSQRAEQLVWLDAATEYYIRLTELVAARQQEQQQSQQYSPTRAMGGSAAVAGAPPLEQLVDAQASKLPLYDSDIVSIRALLTGGASLGGGGEEDH